MQSPSESKHETGVYSGDNAAQYPAAPPPYPGPPTAPGPAAPTAYPHMAQVPTVVHGTTVIHHGPAMVPTVVPAVVVGQQMGPQAASYVCKSCNHQIVTRIERSPSLRTHIFALFLCLVGCWPFACVPYCVDSCNNADHYCTNCGAYIGSYIS